jgi:hypothetical protein
MKKLIAVLFSITMVLFIQSSCQKTCVPPSEDTVNPSAGLRVDYKNISNTDQYIDLVSTNNDGTIIIPTIYEGRGFKVAYKASDDGCLNYIRIKSEKRIINKDGSLNLVYEGPWKEYNQSWHPVAKFTAKAYPEVSNPNRYEIYDYSVYARDCHSNISSATLRIKFRPIPYAEGPIVKNLIYSAPGAKCRLNAYDLASYDVNSRIKKISLSFTAPGVLPAGRKWLIKAGEKEFKNFILDKTNNNYYQDVDIPLKEYDIDVRQLNPGKEESLLSSFSPAVTFELK